MSFLYYALFVVGIVAADQFTKYLTVANIALYADVPFIPGLLQLTYVQNTGAAFSILSQHTWILTALSGVVSLILAVMLAKNYFPEKIARFSMALLLGGAIGTILAAGAVVATGPVGASLALAAGTAAAGGASAAAVGTVVGGGCGAAAGTAEGVHDRKQGG